MVLFVCLESAWSLTARAAYVVRGAARMACVARGAVPVLTGSLRCPSGVWCVHRVGYSHCGTRGCLPGLSFSFCVRCLGFTHCCWRCFLRGARGRVGLKVTRRALCLARWEVGVALCVWWVEAHALLFCCGCSHRLLQLPHAWCEPSPMAPSEMSRLTPHPEVRPENHLSGPQEFKRQRDMSCRTGDIHWGFWPVPPWRSLLRACGVVVV